MRLVVGIPEPHVSREVLEPAAEAVTRLDEQLIERGEVPTFHQALDKGLVKWRPETPGDEKFDHARTVLNRGHGDCDDLAPWRAASARATGEDPGARAVMLRRGPTLWHCVVQMSDGKIEDPSREAGMGKNRPEFAPATPIIKPAQVVGGAKRPHVCLRPIRVRHCIVGYQARVDLPMTATESALVQLHHAPVASQAIVGACNAAGELAEASGTIVDPATWAPVDAIAGLLTGASPHEVALVCGEEAVDRAIRWLDHAEGICGPLHSEVGLFGIHIPIVDDVVHAVEKAGHIVKDVGKALSSVTHVLKPIADIGKQILSAAQGVISLIPGIGTGISAAISAGLAALSGGSPLEIALKTAYGAIPIPPGVRNITDIALDAVLTLLRTGRVEDAALQAARNRLPKGIAQDVFDTLAHLVLQAVHKKPTQAIVTPRPGVRPGTPVQLQHVPVIRALTPQGVMKTFPVRPHAPLPRFTIPRARVAVPARPRIVVPRPGFLQGLPPGVRFVPPAGITFG
jgi:hypothetical protein